MDIYDISFIISTLWVGPFWMAMLLNPKKEKTKKLLAGPWFFTGPIILWFIIMCYNPQGLIDLFSGSSNSVGFIEGLAAGPGDGRRCGTAHRQQQPPCGPPKR